jgi:hypothetical protein
MISFSRVMELVHLKLTMFLTAFACTLIIDFENLQFFVISRSIDLSVHAVSSKNWGTGIQLNFTLA